MPSCLKQLEKQKKNQLSLELFGDVPPSEQAPRDPGQAWCRCVEGGERAGGERESSWMQTGEVEAH